MEIYRLVNLRLSFIVYDRYILLGQIQEVNILASRNRDSGAVETYIPDTETAFDWLNYHS